MDENKQWYLSKRFWSNVLLLLVSVLTAVQQNELFASMDGFLSVVGSVVSSLNILLSALNQPKVQVPVLTPILNRIFGAK